MKFFQIFFKKMFPGNTNGSGSKRLQTAVLLDENKKKKSPNLRTWDDFNYDTSLRSDTVSA
jgi:hypothetical protein